MTTIGKRLRGAVGMLMLAVFVWLAVRYLQADELRDAALSLLKAPDLLVMITAAYALSFVLKSAAWRLYAKAGRSVWLHMAPFGYSLFVNHLLPVKLGDLVRAGVAAKLENKTWDEALHTVAVMRLMDISVLLLTGAVGLSALGIAWEPAARWSILVIVLLAAGLLPIVVLLASGKRGNGFAARQLRLLGRLKSRKAAFAWAITAASWVLEGFVPFGVLMAMQLPIPFIQAFWVNSMTVAGQLFHITPGGIGTYETTMSASLAALGVSGTAAVSAAVVSHAYKFLFAYAAGIVSWLVWPIRWEEGLRWLTPRRAGKGENAE